MKKKLTLLAVVLFPLLLHAQTNVSNNPFSNDRSPDFSSRTTVWEGDSDSTRRIFVRVGATLRLLPSTSLSDRSPKIFNEHVTWIGFDGNDDEIFYTNLNDSVTIQLTDNDHADVDPRIFNGQITWHGGGGVPDNDYEIYLYSDGGVTQLTNNNADDINPRLGATDQVVWQGFDGDDWEIFHFNGTSVIQLTNNSVDDLNPEIEVNGTNIVWQRFDGSDFEIMFKKNTSITQITNNSIDDVRPFTGFSQVLWSANQDGDYDIYNYNGSSILNLSNNDVHDELLFVRGINVVWRSYTKPEGEIFLSGGSIAWQLTFNHFKESDPQTTGKLFVWSGQTSDSGEDEEIYSMVTVSESDATIKLYVPASASFLQGTERTLDFDAYGRFLSPTQFSAQLSNINSETFPATPVILATSNTNPLSFVVPELPVGNYYVRIVSAGGTISNTIAISITTLPNVFITSPSDGAINQKVKLNLTSRTVPGASAYTFELTALDSIGTVITQTGERKQLIDSLRYNTAYKVRVKTDLSPDYGKTTTFTTASAENFAYVISPANGADSVGMKVNVASNLVLYATSYTIELNTDSLFNAASALLKSGGRSLSFSNLSVSKTYYARVKTNLSANWGKTHSFTTGSALDFTYVTSPRNDAVNVSTTTIVRANSVTNASIYTIQLCTSSDFISSPVLEKISATNSASFSGLQYNTKYYARVSTDLATGWGKLSAFTTKTASSLAYVKSPADSAVNQPLTLLVRSNIVPGATHYTIELNTASDFTGTSILKTALSHSISFAGLSSNTFYYSRVKTDLDSAWGATRHFTTIVQATLAAKVSDASTIPTDDTVDISAYPNPFNDELNVMISASDEADAEINLLDFTGQVIVTTKTQTNTPFQIRKKLNPGIYILQIKTKGIIRTFRINKV